MRLLIPLALATVLLTGCPGPVKIEPTIPSPDVKDHVNVDQSLIQYCAEHLAKPAPGEYTQKQILDVVAAWDRQAYSCAKNHNALVDLTRKAFNLPTLDGKAPEAPDITQSTSPSK